MKGRRLRSAPFSLRNTQHPLRVLLLSSAETALSSILPSLTELRYLSPAPLAAGLSLATLLAFIARAFCRSVMSFPEVSASVGAPNFCAAH